MMRWQATGHRELPDQLVALVEFRRRYCAIAGGIRIRRPCCA